MLALAIAALVSFGCSKAPTDSQLTQQVQSKISADSALQGQAITVAVDQGAVTLSGTANDQGSRELASRDAAQVTGVRTVVNNVAVQQAVQTPAPEPAPPVESKPARRAASPPPAPVAKGAAPAAAMGPQVIPAGTSIRVQLSQTLSSKSNQIGDPFSGTLAAPVSVNGRTVIPAGARASGTVTDAKSQGRFKGQAVLSVRLDSVRANGRTYPVQTSKVTHFEKGKGKRSAVMTGGGAGAGALIGGLAGGGKGALIGGLLGGGAGAAGSAFTGSKDLVLPAESVLTFQLTQDVTVQQ